MSLRTDRPAREAEDAELCMRVFEVEFDYVFRSLRRWGVSAADAEDLAQEVFVVMWRKRQDWDRDRPIRPWLAEVAFRTALAHRRRRTREVPSGLIDAEDGARGLDDQLGVAEARELVLQILAKLPSKHRAVFVMHELDEVPIKDIALELSVPLFTAYSRLRRARARFTKEVRRLQVVSSSRETRALSPAILLALPRPPGAPAAAREKLQAWIRQLVTGPAGMDPAPSPARGLAWPRLAPPVVAACMLVGALALVLARRPESIEVAPAPRESAARASAPQTRPARSARFFAAVAAPRLVPQAGADDGAAATLSQGVLAYWSFDEGVGSPTARDLSGRGNDCHLHGIDPGADWIEGVRGGAVRLPGSGWLECPRTEALDRLSYELTISAWVMRAERQNHLRTIVSRQRGVGSDDDFYLGLSLDDVMFSSKHWAHLIAPTRRPPGRWFHVAAVRSRTGVVRLYVDGVEAAKTAGALPSRTSTPDANAVLIGGAVNGPDPSHVDQRLKGAVDEVILFDRALSPDEIATLALGSTPRM